jgi:hypothetical protein
MSLTIIWSLGPQQGNVQGTLLCTHHPQESLARSLSLSLSLGINEVIERGPGQFWECWKIKEATFFLCPFIGSTLRIIEVEQR